MGNEGADRATQLKLPLGLVEDDGEGHVVARVAAPVVIGCL